MRLTVVLLTAAFLQVSAKGIAQDKITLDLKNATLEKVFSEISKQTGFSFFYEDALVQKALPVNIKVKDATLKEVLELTFKGQPLAFIVSDKSIIVKRKQDTQSNNGELKILIDVKGRIVNEKGEAIAGANVRVKGTAHGTTTNDKGDFTLAGVDENAILEITHISIELYEIKIGGRTDLALITVKTRIVESETVTVTANTGFQEIPKERATGSFAIVDNKTLNVQVGTNILDRLNGVASGVLFDTKEQDGRKHNFTVRGLSTINGPKDPLIIIDNFPYEGNINNINPNDIESITILKDAAAASIWGARAGNGVIVINTKKGKFNQPLKIEFTSTIISIEKPDLFYLPLMSSGDFIDVEQMLFEKGAYDNTINNNISYPALSPALEIFLKSKSGVISSQDSALQINELKSVDIRNEYLKHFYRKSLTQQYALNLRGGTDKISYLVSGSFDRNISELHAVNTRLNLRIENVYKPIKNLQITAGILYTNTRSNGGRPGYGRISIGGIPVPYLRFADDNGNALPIATSYRNSYTDTAGAGKLLDWRYYPLEDYKHESSKSDINDLFANFGVQYQITNSLGLEVKYQYERQQTELKQINNLSSYSTRDLINTFTQLDRNAGTIEYKVPLGGIQRLANTKLQAHNVRGQINFNKRWGSHNINAIAGSEIRERTLSANSDIYYGFDENNLTYATSIDFGTRHSTFVTGFPQFIPNGISFDETTNRFVSVYTNFAYAFREKYVISASARRDASNLFGLNANEKWKPFWSTGISWNLSDEPFYRVSFMPQIRIRATYGYSGNVDPSKSAVTVLRYGANDPNTNLPTAIISQLKNSDLRWEKVRTINLGIDFVSKNQILTGSIEYYNKRGLDLYGPSPIDYTAGTVLGGNTVIRNIADMKANGFDVILTTKNLNRQLKWQTTFLFNYNLAKATNYYFPPGVSNASFFIRSGNGISPLVGKPLYSIISYKWAGLSPTTGDPQGYLNGDVSSDYSGIFYSEGDLKSLDNIVYNGPASPRYFGSVANSLQWKGISLTVNLQYQLGYYFRKSSISYDALFNNGIGHADFAKRWIKPGDELLTDVPSMIYPNDLNRDHFYLQSEATVAKADHVRLQFINLSYNLGTLLTSKVSTFSLFEIYLNASNLGIIWRANKEKIDPEYSSSIPPRKTYAAGLRLTF